MFQPQHRQVIDFGLEGGVFAHITDPSFHSVLVRNATPKPISISAHVKLGTLLDYDAEGCYVADPSDAHLAANSSWNHPKRYNFRLGHISKEYPKTSLKTEGQNSMGITAWGKSEV